tara:strand:+ start:407 stop:724 length:318 start_codon:yes stop_codon:yes gene_type:complete
MPDKLIPGNKKTMAYSKSSGFKMAGWSPFTKVTEGEYIDDGSGATIEEGVVSNTAIDNARQAVSDHQKNREDTQAWSNKMDKLKQNLLNQRNKLAKSKGKTPTIT